MKIFDTNGTLIKQFCGYLQQDLIFYSTGNSINIQLKSDSTINAAGFLASWESFTQMEEEEERNESYVLSFPQSFSIGLDAKEPQVCLQMLNLKNDGEVLINIYSKAGILKNEPVVSKSLPVQAGDSSIHCHQVSLPQTLTDKYLVVGIKADINGYKILSYKSVRLLQTKPLALVQTDKYDYRPEQEVNIIVMLMDEELKPSSVTKIDEMWIESPSQSRMVYWRNLKLKQGLLKVDWKLDEEPQLGTWTIKAKYNGNIKLTPVKFQVNEEPLPSFEVKIHAPKFVLKNSQEENFKACAEYNHGSKVKGTANVTISTQYKTGNYWRAPSKKVSVWKLADLVDGCAQVTLNSTEIESLTKKGQTLAVQAFVEEESTGWFQPGRLEESIPVKNTPLSLSSGSSPEAHILNGFPYVGQIKVMDHNGNSKSSNLKICTRLYTSITDLRNYVSSNSHTFYNFNEEQYFELGQKLKEIKFAETCSQHSVGNSGTLEFAVSFENMQIPENVTKLSFEVEALNSDEDLYQPRLTHDVTLTHTDSKSALILQPNSLTLDCQSNPVKVLISGLPNTEIELTHFIASGGNMIKYGTETVNMGTDNQLNSYVGNAAMIKFDAAESRQDLDKPILKEHSLDIQRPFDLEDTTLDIIKLLVYIRDPSGETLSASEEFEIEPCETATVKLSFSKQRVRPGQAIQMNLKGQANGYCGYGIVDKSVSLTPNPNKLTSSKIKKLKSKINAAKIVNDKVVGEKCQDAALLFKTFEKLGLFILSDKLENEITCDSLVDVTNRSKNRYVYEDYAYEEYDGFMDSPVQGAPVEFQLKSDAPIALGAPAARPQLLGNRVDTVNNKLPSPVAFSAVSEEIEEPTVEIRTFFPETWLFELVDLDSDGSFQTDKNAPDTITTWIGDAFCMSTDQGLAIATQASFKVDQDFFLDMKVPYSIKRDEVLPLNVTLFNKLEERSLPLKLQILESDEYKTDSQEFHICLNPDDSQTSSFSLKMKELNEVNITVRATVESLDSCGTVEDAVGFADTVQKPIKVKPEGFPVEKVESKFSCKTMEGPEEFSFNMKLPQDLVEGSARAWLTVTGDILAPSMNSLDKLVKMPYGCGEQNMISMVPNIYVAKYLEGTGQEKPELMAKAKKFMKAGYERQIKNYRHNDGSYSVWGPRDEEAEGSLWLTAFVVKAFSQAASYIDIDNESLDQSKIWLNRKQQEESGCFKTEGFYIHSELAKDSEAALTASILISYLEAPKEILEKVDMIQEPQEPVHIDAFRCVATKLQDQTDTYTKALAAYAYALNEDPKRSQEILNELMDIAINEEGKLFWKAKSDAVLVTSQDVEIAAYNVLTMVKLGKFSEALQVIKWLASQRNANGGFKSTQDTMIALQALAEYSMETNSKENDLKIMGSSSSGDEFDFAVNEDNKILFQMEKLSDLDQGKDTNIDVEVTGKGCLMVQSILRYNIKNSPDQSAFDLQVIKNEDEIKVCASYTGSKDKTNMVVIEIEMLSGYEPTKDSIKSLKNEKAIKKVEYDGKETVLSLYFNQMENQQLCQTVKVKEVAKIGERKPALVKIYDYYDQNDSVSLEYN